MSSYQGNIRRLRKDKGYGFIACDDGADYFFHWAGTVESVEFDELREKQRVEFELAPSNPRPRAINVRLVNGEAKVTTGGPDQPEA